jgi:hypothetical protein
MIVCPLQRLITNIMEAQGLTKRRFCLMDTLPTACHWCKVIAHQISLA